VLDAGSSLDVSEVSVSECAASLVEVDDFDDASSRRCITVAPVVSFASVFGRN
jgi:hypothetical protein